MFFNDHENGFVLVIAMFFLLLLSLLVLVILEDSLLESRIVVAYQNKIESFYDAENHLLQAEKNIITGGEIKDVEVKSIESTVCGVKFYRLISKSVYHGVKTCLESTIAKDSSPNTCSVKSERNIAGRQSFWIVDCY